MRSTLEDVFYEYVYGDWDSLSRWAWVYLHVGIMVATVLVGFTGCPPTSPTRNKRVSRQTPSAVGWGS